MISNAMWYVFQLSVFISVGWANIYWDWQLKSGVFLAAFMATALSTAVVIGVLDLISRIRQGRRGEKPVRVPRLTYPIGHVKRADVDASGHYRRLPASQSRP
jgi:hypothetical protein